MKYEVFCQLVKEVTDYEDSDLYIAERGWQNWMDDLVSDKIVEILETIWEYVKSEKQGKYIVGLTGLSMARFGKKYEIPLRTVENWCSDRGELTRAHFVAFAVFSDLIFEGDDDAS